MIALLVRHSTAVSPGMDLPDENRWLTDEGRERMLTMSARIAEKLSISEIVTSPLVRAVQTAELLSRACSVAEVSVAADLASETGDVRRIPALLAQRERSAVVALVSHMPKIAQLCELLGGGIVDFRTGSAAAVDVERGRLVWQLHP